MGRGDLAFNWQSTSVVSPKSEEMTLERISTRQWRDDDERVSPTINFAQFSMPQNQLSQNDCDLPRVASQLSPWAMIPAEWVSSMIFCILSA